VDEYTRETQYDNEYFHSAFTSSILFLRNFIHFDYIVCLGKSSKNLSPIELVSGGLNSPSLLEAFDGSGKLLSPGSGDAA
jgi:hypothetical protein